MTVSPGYEVHVSKPVNKGVVYAIGLVVSLGLWALFFLGVAELLHH